MKMNATRHAGCEQSIVRNVNEGFGDGGYFAIGFGGVA